ncbi:lipase member H-B-like isoform X2 [Daktulosphaira vitifoliae]|nr:lipase member H-B-like isoform X2 [Daktulosphaira vitifoliae]XP_050523269.1 lipase member H-B-like isoform X2 [Daktulosphaira vitifoliae]
MSIDRTHFSNSNELIVYVHGFGCHYNDRFIIPIPKAYLNRTMDRNIIGVDYSRVTGKIYLSEIKSGLQYPTSVYCDSPKVAEQIATFLAQLVKLKPKIKHIHLIGHSLGAHIVGHVAKLHGQITGRLVDRVTALDPAGPLFYSSSRVHIGVARFVDVVHTNIGVLGYVEPLGNVDFYFNSGLTQIGCNGSLDELIICSHMAAINYFAESVNNKRIIGIPCNDFDNLIKNYNLKMNASNLNEVLNTSCSSNTSSNKSSIIFGEHVPLNASGIYYIPYSTVPNYSP